MQISMRLGYGSIEIQKVNQEKTFKVPSSKCGTLQGVGESWF